MRCYEQALMEATMRRANWLGRLVVLFTAQRLGRSAPRATGAEALADAIAGNHSAKAQEIREWNPATRRGMLAGLDLGLRERHAVKVTELWRVRKGDETCAAWPSTLRWASTCGCSKARRCCGRNCSRVGQARSSGWREALANAGWDR